MMNIPTTPLSNDEIIRNEIAELRREVAAVKTDIGSILETVAKFWEQFQQVKESPMMSAFFPAPRKK